MNDEGIKLEDTKDFTLLGTYNNYWRSRRVEVYKHPTDETKVVTVGYPIVAQKKYGEMMWYLVPEAEAIVCVESYDGTVRGRVEHNDWRDYY